MPMKCESQARYRNTKSYYHHSDLSEEQQPPDPLMILFTEYSMHLLIYSHAGYCDHDPLLDKTGIDSW